MNRVNIQERQPEAYSAMFGLEKYLAQSTVDASLQEIVRIRASIINGCQLCIGMHSKAARKLGVSDERIAALANWKDTRLFNKKEQAVLTMTDAITHISTQGLPEEVYQAAAKFFSEDEISQLIMLIVTINAWNRMGVSMFG